MRKTIARSQLLLTCAHFQHLVSFDFVQTLAFCRTFLAGGEGLHNLHSRFASGLTARTLATCAWSGRAPSARGVGNRAPR